MPPSRPAVVAAIATLIGVWGTTWAAIRLGLRGLPPFSGLALRFAVAAAVLLGLALLLRVRLGGGRRVLALWAVNALLTFALPYSILYWGEQYVPSGLTAVLFATFPLWVAVIAHFVLAGERLSGLSAAGILLGFGGVAVIFSEDLRALGGPRVATAAAVLLLAPIGSALGSVAVKRWGQGLHPLSLTAIPLVAAAALLGLLARATEAGRPMRFDALSVGAVLYLAICGSALTFSLYFWLLAHIPATTLSLFNYATPVVAVATGSVFLHEPVTLRVLAGAALVLAGVSLALRAQARRRSQQASAGPSTTAPAPAPAPTPAAE